jgi:CRISPR system Cascade subunit CasE
VSPLHLSRVRLRRDAPVAALAPLLLPPESGERAGTTHRLLWTLFADAPDRERDFLWRETGDGGLVPGRSAFMVLSARQPHDAHGLFELESKEFAPALAPGDRLAFSLRANPVVTRPDPRKDGKPARHDVVMDRLRAQPPGERAGKRLDLVREAGRDWLLRQGERAGFVPVGEPRIDGYEQLRIERQRKPPVRFSVLDLDGTLEVRDPEAFLAALPRGFGKAKAFGCGLMLIRRA